MRDVCRVLGTAWRQADEWQEVKSLSLDELTTARSILRTYTIQWCISGRTRQQAWKGALARTIPTTRWSTCIPFAVSSFSSIYQRLFHFIVHAISICLPMPVGRDVPLNQQDCLSPSSGSYPRPRHLIVLLTVDQYCSLMLSQNMTLSVSSCS